MHDVVRRVWKARLREQVRQGIRRLHYSLRTEETYLQWIRRFIYFHGKRHPRDLGPVEVTAFLNHLARDRGVADSTQNQALASLLFLYKEVLTLSLPWLEGLERVRKPARVPTVLTASEAQRLLSRLAGDRWLMASLLYGAGLRRIRRRGAARCAAREVPPSRVRMGMEVRLSFVQGLGGSPHRRHQAPSRIRKLPRSRGQAGRTRRWDCEARELSYIEALFCDAPARERLRHPHRPGAARPRERRDDDDLHARHEQGRARGEEPARPARAAARGVPGARLAKALYNERCALSFSVCALIAARAFSQSSSVQAKSSLNEPPLTRQAPPSTAMVWPVRNSQPSAMRKAARFCSSSIFPARRIGLPAPASLPGSRPGARRLPAPSVGKIPAAMALTRIP